MKYLTLIILAACGYPDAALNSPTALVFDESCNSYQLLPAIVQQAAHEWDPFGGEFRLLSEIDNQSAPQITVYCDQVIQGSYPDDLTIVGDYDQETPNELGSVHLLSKIVNEWSNNPNERNLLQHTVTHELGHALGLIHELDPTAMMYFNVSEFTAPNATDAAQLCAIRSDSNACLLDDGGLWPDPDYSNH